MSTPTLACAAASSIAKTDTLTAIGLAHHCELVEVAAVPCFFRGRLREPYLIAKCLTAIANTVRARFALTAQELAALRDPIVTAGEGQVRFEGFSSCNGVYARLDIAPEALEGEFPASGTTNVDFNEPMIHALNGITKSEAVTLAVGSRSVTVITEQHKAVEKKVTLPTRWIKGLTSVQHYLAAMEEVMTLNRMQAVQLFQSLPRTTVKSTLYLVQRGGRTTFSPVAAAGGRSVPVGGAHRLRLMEGLLPFADALHIYAPADGQAVGFVVALGPLRMVFAFSADAYRGFSGEGKALEHLIEELPLEMVYGATALLKANAAFDPTLLALDYDLPFATADAITASLSSIGLLGYDLAGRNYFYRRLPFKTERILSLNPRLKNARRIVAGSDIVFNERKPGYTEARVAGTGGVYHTVVIQNNASRCTCDWFTKYQDRRGLCKHVLAVKMAVG